VKAVLSDAKPGVSLRDKAIVTMALCTGLRSSGIAGIELASIDWDRDLLHVNQQKTDTPLTLPLPAIVGNAASDYMNDERPQSGHRHVFISKTRLFGKLANAAICGIVQKAMKAAGIRQSPGDGQGLRIFRHHAATALLGNGVPRPVISSVIGHASPNCLTHA
jgi:integrase